MHIVIIIPCLNEALAIDGLVHEIRKNMPVADINIFDNDSTDETVKIAKSLGVAVHSVLMRGKGRVFSRMIADLDADVYVMIDGDNTYDLTDLQKHVTQVIDGKIDMLIGSRMNSYRQSRSRIGHQFGNIVITKLVNFLFSCHFHDVLSGYRIMSKRFVKSAPILAHGFELEMMLTVHALEIDGHVTEEPVTYRQRVKGSTSKLRTFRDGYTIVSTMIYLFKAIKPFSFFGMFSILFLLISLGLGLPILIEFTETGLVPRFPTAILAASLAICSLISLSCGIVLDAISKQKREIKRCLFLAKS